MTFIKRSRSSSVSSWMHPKRIFVGILSVLFLLSLAVIFGGQQALPPPSSSTASSSVHLLRVEQQHHDEKEPPMVLRTLHVQIVHRHGDRTPITPLQNEAFWQTKVASADVLEKLAQSTVVVREDDPDQSAAAAEILSSAHQAKGRGPFGQLTQRGIDQMTQVGIKLRSMLYDRGDAETFVVEEDGTYLDRHVWNDQSPLDPSNIRILSTDFPRTIQSVQAVLSGLFPNDQNNVSAATAKKIPIDVRFSDMIIPDPQPRPTQEQVELEQDLAVRPHILERERDMKPLAVRATRALEAGGILGDEARTVSFGVAEGRQQQKSDAAEDTDPPPLSWNQLAEILTCLVVHDRLPDPLTLKDQQEISRYLAWRWFETLCHPRMTYLSMHDMVAQQILRMLRFKDMDDDDEPPVTIWSAHDSVLIGMMCAYRLEQPSVWPEYGSYLIIELVEKLAPVDDGKGAFPTTTRRNSRAKTNDDDLYVRFSLNGEYLRSKWATLADDDGSPKGGMVPLALLKEKTRTEMGYWE